MILGRMSRRGFLTPAQYAEAMGLPPPAPDTLSAIDSTGTPDSAAAPAPEGATPEPEPEPAPPEPESAAPDTIPPPR
jgi:hypothetical protein